MIGARPRVTLEADQAARELASVRALLALESMAEHHAWLRSVAAWLVAEHPRCLISSFRKRLAAIMGTAPRKRPSWMISRRRGKPAPAAQPDWMADPSLLPKAPPGR